VPANSYIFIPRNQKCYTSESGRRKRKKEIMGIFLTSQNRDSENFARHFLQYILLALFDKKKARSGSWITSRSHQAVIYCTVVTLARLMNRKGKKKNAKPKMGGSESVGLANTLFLVQLFCAQFLIKKFI
jgi:hypothetical protein